MQCSDEKTRKFSGDGAKLPFLLSRPYFL